jgi:hypothetical protein
MLRTRKGFPHPDGAILSFLLPRRVLTLTESGNGQ